MGRDTNVTLDVASYTLLLSACLRQHKWPLAESIFAEMPTMAVLPNAVTFNVLLSSCARRRQWEKALGLFCDAQDACLDTNVTLYNTMINACGGFKWQLGLALLSEMQEECILSDAV